MAAGPVERALVAEVKTPGIFYFGKFEDDLEDISIVREAQGAGLYLLSEALTPCLTMPPVAAPIYLIDLQSITATFVPNVMARLPDGRPS